jgi:hypothetical protein
MSDLLQLVANLSKRQLPNRKAKAYRTEHIRQTLPQIYRTFMTAFSRTSIVILFERELSSFAQEPT